MNCKPGDLAVICRITDPENTWMLGKIVQCMRLEVMRGRAGWHLADGISHAATVWEWQWVADDCLRPIRDPGDDAQDETLSWLPVPSREEVVA